MAIKLVRYAMTSCAYRHGERSYLSRALKDLLALPLSNKAHVLFAPDSVLGHDHRTVGGKMGRLP